MSKPAIVKTIPLLAALFAISCSPAPEPDRFAAAKQAVAAKLTDPSSVQFRDISACGESETATGEFNAKNGFGGYVGFEPFYYHNGAAHFPGDAGYIPAIGACAAAIHRATLAIKAARQ